MIIWFIDWGNFSKFVLTSFCNCADTVSQAKCGNRWHDDSDDVHHGYASDHVRITVYDDHIYGYAKEWSASDSK